MGIDRSLLFRLATSVRFERGVKALPGAESVAWQAASCYVAGRSLSDAIAAARTLVGQGHGVSVDLFGERVSDPQVADEVCEAYLGLVAALPPPPADVWVSVDLSHLAVAADPAGAAGRLGATVQANLLRSAADATAFADAGVVVRLVKGAYLEPAGAYPYGEATDIAFLRLGFRLAERGAEYSIATHDGLLREALLLAGGHRPVGQLLGVRPDALVGLRQRGVPTRVTSPTGRSGSATGCDDLPNPEAPDPSRHRHRMRRSSERIHSRRPNEVRRPLRTTRQNDSHSTPDRSAERHLWSAWA